ncbi:MetQ/NlpA family ABC transporter substrate-binding protein [Helicobacter cetorum]|uniref:Lipoprotein n=1 Tax=Helicobacter cetorum (strain ATCC BAA-540 / CCUG 52418 / MIT 99-5656) TaxID=1163745 RepID=I0ES48_HELCM|nr:MetQ/NlpA family ABC transporter substrate-binding protein [Helicobacter cetorum]AFI05767.1 ABC transporter substrate-binding protein [Helicobacter cetorum MIT 99-5656]
MNVLKRIICVVMVTLGLFNLLQAKHHKKKNEPTQEIKVGATPVPHAQILQSVVEDLKAQGITLTIVPFTDYVLPNLALNDGSIDVNFFQHRPYLDRFNLDRKMHLVDVASIHVEPLRFYSKKITSMKNFKKGSVIAVPNDPSNQGRALILLHKQEIITLKDPSNLYANEFDIIKNPYNIKIKPLESAMLPKVLADVDGAVVPGNYALQAKLTDALFSEGKDSPYANILATREDNAQDEGVKRLVQALRSDKTKQFILDTFKGAIIPAF